MKFSSFTVSNLKKKVELYPYLLSFVVFTVQFVFGLYCLSENSLWYDENFSIYCAVKPVSQILEIAKQDVNPPLYAIILHYWVLVFGDSEFSVRLLSNIAMAAAAGLFFKFNLRFFNKQTALYSFLLFLTSNALFYYAQEARTYALVILVTVAANYFLFLMFYESRTKKKYLYALLLGLSYALLFYLHFLACFLVIGHFIVFLIWIVKKENSKLMIDIPLVKSYILSGIFFLLLIVPFLYRFLGLAKDGVKNMWLSKPTFLDFQYTLYDFFNSETNLMSYIYLLTGSIILILFRKLRHPVSGRLIIFSITTGIFLLTINYFFAAITPIFLTRYVLFTFIGIILTITYIYSLVRINFFIKLSIFLVLIYYSVIYLPVPKPIKQDYKNAVAYILKSKNDQTLIVTDLFDTFLYYYDKELFYVPNDQERLRIANTKNIYFNPYDFSWPDTFDFKKYKKVIYIRSFDYLNDPNNVVLTKLNHKLTFNKFIYKYQGIRITEYDVN